MQLNSLTAISPIDGRYAAKMESLRPLCSEYGLIYHRVVVEVQWLLALTSAGISGIPVASQAQQDFFKGIISNFSFECAQEVKQIEATTHHDVKAVEYFIRNKLAEKEELHVFIPYIHFACTSEDINNLAYALIAKKARQQVLLPLISAINSDLQQKSLQYAELTMLSRTHGQTASPTTLGKEFANVVARLTRQLNQFNTVELLGKFNGAVGNYNAHHIAFPEINWPEFTTNFIESLGLVANPMTTQIEPHDYLAEYLHVLTRVNTILLDLARDIWSYISIGYFHQQSRANEIGSSTMPHKINPIDFENAEGNLGMANSLGEHLALKLPISRWQRDLSDSTVLRNLGSVIAYSALAYQSLHKGLTKISANTTLIQQDLANRWEVIAEAVQTVMRRHGVADAYEQLKQLTRGKVINADIIRQFIDQSVILPAATKKVLLALTPSDYSGYAAALAKEHAILSE